MKEKIRVLLADDEEAFVKGMARILKRRGFEVRTAQNGIQAIDAFEQGDRFDVVVLDIKMPGMDGIQTLDEIKRRAPETEVIMLTGHASLSSGARALRRGAYDYLMKPCDAEDLIEKIREAYEAEKIRKDPVLWPRKPVCALALHPLRRLLPEDPVSRALDAMRREAGKEAVEEIFIVNEGDGLAGVVTKRDLLDLAEKTSTWERLIEHPERLPERPIGDIMKQDPISIEGDASLSDAAEKMVLHRVRSLPVLRAGKVLGVIRLQDVFQSLEDEME